MSRYFNIKLTGGTSSGPYSIYYDNIMNGSLATLYPSGLPASGITLADLTSPLGVGVQVPDDAITIILYNEKCNTYETFDIGPSTDNIICFCLTVIPIAGQPDEIINQVYFCPTGTYFNGHPVYEGHLLSDGTLGVETYSLTWNELKKYWEVNGLPFIDGPIRSYDSSNVPLTGWEVFGECNNDYMIIADEGECPDPTTIYFINCEQTNPTCLSINNGSIVSYAIGGGGGWVYSLDEITYTPIGLFTSLYAGSYTVYAKDISGNTTSCSVLLEAPASTTYPLIIGITTYDRYISTSLGFKYYRLDYQIDTSGLPNGVSITFDFVLSFLLNYIQPGTASFDTNSSVIKKNGTIIPLNVVSSQTPIQNGQSSCNSTYGNFDGFYKVSATNIVVTNTDTIDGYIVYGINTDTSGQYLDSCLTKANVNVVATLENAKTNTVCDSVSVVSLNYNRIQTFSGESIVTVINTTNPDGGGVGVGTTTTQGTNNSVCNYYCITNNVSGPSTNQSFNYSMSPSQTISTSVGGDTFFAPLGNVIYNNAVLSSPNYSTSNGRYTASCRGLYQFSFSLKVMLTITNFSYTDLTLTFDLNTYDQNGNFKTNILVDTVAAYPSITSYGPYTVSNIAMDIGDYAVVQLYYSVTDFSGPSPTTLALMITDGFFGSNSQDIYIVNCRGNNNMVVAYTDCGGIQQNTILPQNGTTILIQSPNYSSISIFWEDNRLPLPSFSNGDYTISGLPCNVTPTTTSNNTTPTTTRTPFKVWRLVTCSQPYINDPDNQGSIICNCWGQSYIIVYTSVNVNSLTDPNAIIYTDNNLNNLISQGTYVLYNGSIYYTSSASTLGFECTP